MSGEGHRALPTVHAHVGERRQILPGGVGNPCADRDLARVGVEPGDQGIEVTRRGDTDGVADSGRGYALFGRPARIGPDHQLGTIDACGRGDVRYLRTPAQLMLQVLPTRPHRLPVVASQDEGQLFAQTATADRADATRPRTQPTTPPDP